MDFFESRFFELLRSIVLGVAITILYPLMVYYVIQVVHPQPKYVYETSSDQLEQLRMQMRRLERSKETILALPGQKDLSVLKNIESELNTLDAQLVSIEQATEQKRKEQDALYQEQMQPYEKTFFMVSSIAGLLALLIGAFSGIPFLGFGFIMSGVFTLTMGYVSYWGRLHDILKFISLLGAIVLIIAISFYMMRKNKN